MYHSSHFFGLISAYNPIFINKVDIIKNGTSSVFGNGVSSTINMRSKNKVSDSFNGGIGFNLISGNVFFEIPIHKKLSLHVYGRRSLSDFFKTITYQNYFDTSFQDSSIETSKKAIGERNISSSFSFYDYNFKVLYDITSKNKLRVNFLEIKNKLLYGENSQLSKRKSTLNQHKKAVGVNLKTTWGNRFKSNFNYYFTKYSIVSNDEKNDLNQKNFQLNSVEESSFKLMNAFKLKPLLDLNFGFQVTETGVLNQSIINIPLFKQAKKEVLLTSALFSELVYHQQNTYVRAGIRTIYVSKNFKHMIEPRLSLQQKVASYFKINVLGEFKHQAINQSVDFKNHFLGVENRRWIIANNQNVPLVKSKQLSVGGTFNKNNFQVSFNSFYKVVNGITASGQGFQNQFKFEQSQGRYKTLGSELLINKTGKRYSAWLTYTVSNNDYYFKHFDPKKFVSNLNITHSSSVAFNYDVTQKIKTSLGIRWKTGNVYTKPIENNPVVKKNGVAIVNFDVPNSSLLPNYFRIDASLKYKFDLSKKATGTLSIGVLNLTHQQNVVNRYYAISKKDNTVLRIDNKSLNFTPNMSANFCF